MYILTLESNSEGVYCIKDDYGDQIIPIFEDEDDASRYFCMLEDSDSSVPPLQIVEVDEDVLIPACESRSQKYVIITTDDFIIPPKDLV